jgi:glycolate oxidase iron-sulfur subunit
VLLLEGCVQPALSPNTNAAAARLLDRLGISVEPAREAGCCGAVDYHLDAQAQGLQRARHNIDAWWPAIEAGAEAIVQTASGCGAFVRDYGHLLKDDAMPPRPPGSAPWPATWCNCCRPSRWSSWACVPNSAWPSIAPAPAARLKLGGAVEGLLTRLGFHLTSVPDGHLCCGSAGTYSLTQPALSRQLRDNRLAALESGKPAIIATANIGCQLHLDGAGRTPVRHWIEIVEDALEAPHA